MEKGASGGARRRSFRRMGEDVRGLVGTKFLGARMSESSTFEKTTREIGGGPAAHVSNISSTPWHTQTCTIRSGRRR